MLKSSLSAPVRFFFGDDIFISYARRDGVNYAEGLASALAARNLACRVDLWETTPGADLPPKLRRALKWSKMFVLLGTEAAAGSKYVALELQEFLRTGGTVVPIDLGGMSQEAPWHSLITGLPITRDLRPEALVDGKPSEGVLSRVENSATFVRRNRRIQYSAVAAAFILLGLTIWSFERMAAAKRATTEAAAAQGERQTAVDARVAAEKAARKSLGEAEAAAASLVGVNANLETAKGELINVRLQAAEAERSTRTELARSASMMARTTGQEREATEAALKAFLPGRWFTGPPSAEVIRGLTEAVGAIWYSLPLEGSASDVEAAVFTADGRMLVADGPKGRLAWSATSGKRVPLTADHAQVAVLDALRRSGRTSGGRAPERSNDSVTLTDPATGKAVRLPGAQEVSHYAFSPYDGELVATGGRNGELHVWTPDAELYATLEGHSKDPYFERYEPLDVRRDTGAVYQKTGGKIVRHSNIGINFVAFAPRDPSLLISASNDRSAIIWDLRFKEQKAVLGGHELEVRYADFSPSGKYAVTGSDDGAVRLWDTSGRPLTKLDFHRHPLRLVAFSADETRLATFSTDGAARIWRPFHDDSIRTFDDRSRPLERVSYSPDGTFIAASSQVDGYTRVWNAGTGQRVASLDHVKKKDPRMELASRIGRQPGEDGESSDPSLRVPPSEAFRYGYPTRDRLGNALRGANTKSGLDAGPVFSRKGDRLLTQTGNLVVFWDTRDWRPTATFDLHEAILSAAAMSNDGALVVSADNARNAYLWNARTGKSIASLPIAGTVTSVEFSPRGDSFATSSYGDGAALWNASTGRPVHKLHPSATAVYSLVYSRDGALILIAGQELAWSILNATTGKIVRTVRGASDAAVFSPDHGKVLTRHDKGATLWDASTGKVIAKLDGHDAYISAAWFSEDGRRIVTASFDEDVRLWDAETGAPLGVLRGHLGRVNHVVPSPDDRYAATASMDGTVKVFPVHLDQFLARARAALGQN